MTTLSNVPLRSGYVTGRDNLLLDFYIPCLQVAQFYDRAVGYFRSTLYVVAGIAFSDFAQRGGTARLICSPHLTEDDVQAMERGFAFRDRLEANLEGELRIVLAEPRNRPIAELLATLIGLRCLDIRLAFRPLKRGVFHDKVGVFTDSTDQRVSFLGSPNETFSAWDLQGNHEGLEVFRSWEGPVESERVERHRGYFKSLWSGNEPGVEIHEFPEAFKRNLLKLADPAGIDPAAERVRKVISTTPIRVVPERPRLQDHQSAVVGSWFANNCRGLITHVTGAGKTVSALEIVRRWIVDRGPAIIFVPSDLLSSQWRSEIERFLGDIDPAVLNVGAGASRDSWEPVIADFTRDMDALGPRVIVATMQSGATPAFLEKVVGGTHLLVVADEVHRVGSSNHRRLLTIDAGGRLGLSATPERYGDPSGTAAIYAYFGPVLQPLFTLEDAIRAGRLVPYEYHVHEVQLTTVEQDSWDSLTDQIRTVYARLPKDKTTGRREQSEYLKRLLFRRASVLKGAEGKASLASDLLSRSFQPDDRWLVYCDNQVQLGAVLTLLRAEGLPADEYHTAMPGSPEATMQYFRERGGILVAIRCLDEGVDIPTVSAALILASSSNRREFIQRRGRVLRTAPGKFSAVIHDAFVVPAGGDSPLAINRDPILRIEIARSLEFARSARNLSVRYELEEIARGAGLTEDDLAMADFEPEDGGGNDD